MEIKELKDKIAEMNKMYSEYARLEQTHFPVAHQLYHEIGFATKELNELESSKKDESEIISKSDKNVRKTSESNE